MRIGTLSSFSLSSSAASPPSDARSPDAASAATLSQPRAPSMPARAGQRSTDQLAQGRELLVSTRQTPANEATTATTARLPMPYATVSIVPPPPRFSTYREQHSHVHSTASQPSGRAFNEIGSTHRRSMKMCACIGTVVVATTALVVGGYFFAATPGK